MILVRSATVVSPGGAAPPDNSTIEVASGLLQVKDSGITAAKLAPGVGVSNFALVEKKTVAAAVQTLTFTTNINAHGSYLLILKNSSDGANCNLSIYFNADTTATNYYSERIVANNAALASSRDNTAILHGMTGGDDVYSKIWIFRSPDGHVYAECDGCSDKTATVIIDKTTVTTAGTVANVTEIMLSGSAGSCFGIGCTAMLYKLTEA